MSKINVYSSSASNAIKVFDASSTGLKPDNAILVTTGTEPSNAIQINVGENNWSSIAVNFGGEEPEPPGPSLPPYTIRLKYKQGITPSFNYGTVVLYDAEENIWDLTYEHNDWSNLLYNNRKDVLEVIEANTEGVVNMNSMFYECNSLSSVCMLDTSKVTDMILMFSDCKALTTIPLFNTSKVTNMGNMFTNCRALTSVPLFDTSNVTDMRNMFSDCRVLTSIPLFDTSSLTNMPSMFYNCYNVQTGALALYQQASSQTNPPSNYWASFRNCGRDTQTGSEELAQIPADWK